MMSGTKRAKTTVFAHTGANITGLDLLYMLVSVAHWHSAR